MVIHYSIYFVAGFYGIIGIFQKICGFCLFYPHRFCNFCVESCLVHHCEKIRKFWRGTIAESPLISSLRSILKNAMVIYYSIYFVAGFYEIAGIFKRFYRFCVFVNIYVKVDCFGDKSPRNDGKREVVIARKSVRIFVAIHTLSIFARI